MKITIFSPSGVVLEHRRLQLAVSRLTELGATVAVDESVEAQDTRFAGTNSIRLEAIHRVANDDSDIALASRGGYGLSRLVDDIDWRLIAQSVYRGKYWVGHSDFTAFNLALYTHTKAPSWAGPMALADFGRIDASVVTLPAVNRDTSHWFMQAMRGELAEASFITPEGFDGLEVSGTLWGGNLSMINSLLATPHWPDIQNGILFLEDVNERPYCVERMLLQLHQAGILKQQKAILLGDFSGWNPTPIDRSYGFNEVLECIRSVCDTPILTDLPFGHTYTKLTLPVGVEVNLTVSGQHVKLHWEANKFAETVHNSLVLSLQAPLLQQVGSKVIR